MAAVSMDASELLVVKLSAKYRCKNLPVSNFSTQVRFRRKILPILERHGKEIGVRSREGDTNCATIIRLYMMLYKLCDSGTLAVLEETLKRAGYDPPPYFEDEL